MNNLEISTRFCGIKLIIFLSMVFVGTIYLKMHMTSHSHLQPSLNSELSEASLNLTILDTNGRTTKFRDVLSVQESTWIYFFSPNCLACNKIIRDISETYLDNLIGIAFTAPSYLAEYQAKNEILFPLYSISPRYADYLGIHRVPLLIQVNSDGYVRNEIKDLKNVIVIFNQMKLIKNDYNEHSIDNLK